MSEKSKCETTTCKDCGKCCSNNSENKCSGKCCKCSCN